MEIFLKNVGDIREKKQKREAARAFLKEVLAHNLGYDAEILTGKGGKPYAKGNPVYFNLSHSHELVAVALSRHEVGVDVEYMKERNFAKLSLQVFGEEVLDKEAFYERWTQFEAMIKLYGLSIFSELKERPRFVYTQKLEGYVLSVASAFEEEVEILS